MSRKSRSFPEKIAGISIGTTVLFITTAAIAGIIGNRADTLFLWLWGIATTINSRPWIILFIILIIGFALVLIFLQRNSVMLRIELHKVNSAMDTMNLLIGLDDSLLRLLATWMCANDREEGMKLLLANLLQDATKAFSGEVHRAIIFLPDATKDFLRAWASYQMPQETLLRTNFYIGKSDDRKRGLAGEAFIDQTIHVAHIVNKSKGWKCDREDCYIDFDKKRPFPPYNSLVCIPLLEVNLGPLTPHSIASLGVVCFDSENPTIFDNPGALPLLQIFGRRIAAALLIYEQFRSLNSLKAFADNK